MPPDEMPVTPAVTLRAWTSRSPPKPRTSLAGCGTSCASMCSPPRRSTTSGAPARGHDDHGHPPVLEELKAEARKRDLWNLFHHELAGLSNLEYASVAEITGWSPVDRTRGDQLRRPGHRQHGDAHVVRHRRAEAAVARAAAGGRDPLRLRDDGAGRRLVGRAQHPDLDRPRRRRLRDQRPQVVDQRCRRRALPDLHRDGQDRPGRRTAPPAVDGPRAPRHPGPGDHPAPAGVRVPGPARALRAAVHRRPGAGDQPARR